MTDELVALAAREDEFLYSALVDIGSAVVMFSDADTLAAFKTYVSGTDDEAILRL